MFTIDRFRSTPGQWNYRRRTSDEGQQVLTQWRRVLSEGQPLIVSGSDYQQQFEKFSNGERSVGASMLSGLNWSNVVVAGGSVLACLLRDAPPEYFASSDVRLDFALFLFFVVAEKISSHCLCRSIYSFMLCLRRLPPLN
jgi:DNA modification methylase